MALTDGEIGLAEQSASPFVRAFKEIAFGSTAGMIGKVFEHPFDLTKVRLQSQVLDEKARFSGPIHVLRHTWTNEGIRGLFRGLPAPVAGAMLENAVLFLSYAEFQRAIRRFNGLPLDAHLSLPQICLAAAGAGGITSFVLTPIELVKCKMQVQMLAVSPAATLATGGSGSASQSLSATFKSLPGPFQVLSGVFKKEGFRGLWLGQTGTFIRETGGGAAWFGANELTAKYFMSQHATREGKTMEQVSRKDLTPVESAIAGAAAGISFNIILFPADTIKSTIQTEEELRPRSAREPRRNFLQTGVAMWKAQGIKGLYAGLGITVLRAIPSNALIFLVYDTLARHFG